MKNQHNKKTIQIRITKLLEKLKKTKLTESQKKEIKKIIEKYKK